MRDVPAPRISKDGEASAGPMSASLQALPPGSLRVDVCDAYRIVVHVGPTHRLWEWHEGRAQDGPHRRGDIVVTAVGESRRVRWDEPSSFFTVRLAEGFVRSVGESLDVDVERAGITGGFGHRDPALEHLAFALLRATVDGVADEARDEAIATAMAGRLLEGYARRRGPVTSPGGGLAPRTLGRVVELVHGTLDGAISIGDMARVAGLSPFHFARQFRRSTGVAPHAYVVRARVHEATRLILEGADAADAAARVGFSSQGHLTRHMRRLLGVTPGRLSGRRAS